MNLKIENLLIIGLFAYIVFISTCNTKPEPIIKTIETVRVDSVRVYDTIKSVLKVPYSIVPLKEVKPLKGIDLSDTAVFTANLYTYAKKDSLLSYEIEVESECEPYFVRMKYDINQFTILDSVFIRDSTHVKEQIKRSFMSFGGSVIVGKDFGFAPQLVYSHKSGSNFGLGYDLINKNYHFTYTKKIKLRR